MYSPNSPVYEGVFSTMHLGKMILPYQYTGYKDEILASKISAWIGLSLMMSPIYDVSGPDTVDFFHSICVNDFTHLDEKGLRHAVICNEKGQILTDGLVIKIEENTYRTYWLNPPIDYLVKTSGMDIEGADVSGQEYFIQISGEKSLEILEKACEADLRDIKFAKHRMTSINGKPMRVIRLGMTGNLSYEVHGPIQEFEEAYRKIWEAGQSFGAKKLGFQTYCMSHTEGGFPNIHIHYPLPWFESDPGLAEYLKENPQLGIYNLNRRLYGSVGNDIQSRFVTPYDVGWGFLVKFDHEFTGRKALEEVAKNPPRTVTTLEWNADDIAAVYASQFQGKGVEPCERIDAYPLDMYYMENTIGEPGEGFIYRADKTMTDGKQIGISTGRVCSYYYNTMISLGFINPKYAVEGKELTLIWGTPGTPQKEIRVKVTRFPYIDLIRNEDRDVSTIPTYKG